MTVSNPAELGEAFTRAKAADKTQVIVMNVDAYEGWTTEGHTWWEVGTPEVSNSKKVLDAHPLQPSRAVIKRVAECELIIDPMQMKSIAQWLNQKIEDYEKLFGRIPSPEEVENRSRRKDDSAEPTV